MALLNKRYASVHNKTGDDKEKLKVNFDEGHINTLTDLADNGINPEFGALLYQIQLMQDDIDELRRYITAEVGDGAKGDAGNAGARGATGSTGSAGARGAAGAAGSDGSDASVDLFMRQFNGSKLPKSSKGLAAGALWNDRGTIRIV